MMDTKDPEAASGPSPERAEEDQTPLRWPPPGLARLQGDLYVAAAWLGAGAFLILPLLWAVVADQDPWSLGPLGESLRLAFLFGALGIPVLLGGYIALGRLLRRSSMAVNQGHHWRVVALAATDHRHDTGFLLQGLQAYSLVPDDTRRRMASVRIAVGGLFLFGALWLSLGFGIGVVLAARGVLGRWAVVALVLGPSAVAGGLGALMYAWQERMLRRARKRWFKRSWSQALVRDEIRSWQAAMSELAPGVAHPEELPEGGGWARATLRASYVGLSVAAVMAFLPVFTLVFSAAIIPVLARISVPEFDRSVRQFAAAEPLRTYALEPDTTMTATDAGAALHTLSFVGRPYRATEGVLPPPRSYPEPWFPATDTAAQPSAEWLDGMVSGIGREIPAGERAYMDSIAVHPAHVEMERLARAGAMDIAGVRWSVPLPSDITLPELSIPALGTIRDAAYAHLAVAAVEADRGEIAAADTTIREVLSVGLLMADESPTVLDNLVGLVLADLAGQALTHFYHNTDHPDADALAWGLASAERSVDRARPAAIQDVSASLRAMPQNALDSTFLRGVRWEYVGLLNTLGPCINLQRVVFGPGADYRRWLEQVEGGLVRYPAEAELFQVARSGLLGGEADAGSSLSTGILALTMGDPDQPGSCARVMGEVIGF